MNIPKSLQLITLTLLIASSNLAPLIAHSNIYNFFGPNSSFLKDTKASEIQNITFNNFDKHKHKNFILDMFETEHENLVGDCKEFSANYALENLQLFPGSEPITIKVACLNNMPVGFVIYSMLDEKIGQIDVLCVNNDYRRCGYGKALLNHAVQNLIKEQKTTHVQLGVHKNNHCAINLYCKYGFSFFKAHDATTDIYLVTT